MAVVTERIPYYVVKNGVGYWQPPPWARVPPYSMEGCRCGPDGVEARAIARDRNRLMKSLREAPDVSNLAEVWPAGSLGSWFEKWRRSEAFGRKALGTRNEFDQAWAHVSDALKRKLLKQIRPGDIERWQIGLEKNKTDWTRWRAVKKLREIFAAAIKYGVLTRSPACTLPNPTPAPRSQLWLASEVQTLIDTADELGKPDMALAIALLWATMMSPVDVRTLSRSMVLEDKRGLYIHRRRTKTAAHESGEVYVDLPDPVARRLKAYMNGTPTTLPLAPIIRGERAGHAFENRHEFARRFDTIRAAAFGEEEKRQMRDIRRSANVEADLGGAAPEERAAILANTLHKSSRLEATYTPPTLAKARELRKQREAGRAMLESAGLGPQGEQDSESPVRRIRKATSDPGKVL